MDLGSDRSNDTACIQAMNVIVIVVIRERNVTRWSVPTFNKEFEYLKCCWSGFGIF